MFHNARKAFQPHPSLHIILNSAGCHAASCTYKHLARIVYLRTGSTYDTHTDVGTVAASSSRPQGGLVVTYHYCRSTGTGPEAARGQAAGYGGKSCLFTSCNRIRKPTASGHQARPKPATVPPGSATAACTDPSTFPGGSPAVRLADSSILAGEAVPYLLSLVD